MKGTCPGCNRDRASAYQWWYMFNANRITTSIWRRIAMICSFIVDPPSLSGGGGQPAPVRSMKVTRKVTYRKQKVPK